MLFSPERGGKAAALSRGLATASGDVVVMTDANNVLEPGSVRAAVRHFADPDVLAVAGRRGEAGSAYDRYEGLISSLESRSGSVAAMSGEFMAVRARHLPPFPQTSSTTISGCSASSSESGGRSRLRAAGRSTEEAVSVAAEVARRSRMGAGRVMALSELRGSAAGLRLAVAVAQVRPPGAAVPATRVPRSLSLAAPGAPTGRSLRRRSPPTEPARWQRAGIAPPGAAGASYGPPVSSRSATWRSALGRPRAARRQRACAGSRSTDVRDRGQGRRSAGRSTRRAAGAHVRRRSSHRGPDARRDVTSTGRSASASSGWRSSTSQTGDQPIFNEDGSVVVVFNGEIYNFRELRARARAPRATASRLAATPRSSSTSTRSTAPTASTHLRGMFAFALWDARAARAAAGARPGRQEAALLRAHGRRRSGSRSELQGAPRRSPSVAARRRPRRDRRVTCTTSTCPHPLQRLRGARRSCRRRTRSSGADGAEPTSSATGGSRTRRSRRRSDEASAGAAPRRAPRGDAAAADAATCRSARSSRAASTRARSSPRWRRQSPSR